MPDVAVCMLGAGQRRGRRRGRAGRRRAPLRRPRPGHRVRAPRAGRCGRGWRSCCWRTTPRWSAPTAWATRCPAPRRPGSAPCSAACARAASARWCSRAPSARRWSPWGRASGCGRSSRAATSRCATPPTGRRSTPTIRATRAIGLFLEAVRRPAAFEAALRARRRGRQARGRAQGGALGRRGPQRAGALRRHRRLRPRLRRALPRLRGRARATTTPTGSSTWRRSAAAAARAGPRFVGLTNSGGEGELHGRPRGGRRHPVRAAAGRPRGGARRRVPVPRRPATRSTTGPSPSTR